MNIRHVLAALATAGTLLAAGAEPAFAAGPPAPSGSQAKAASCVANVSAVITKGRNPVPQSALPDSLATKLDKAAASSFKAAAAPGAIVGVSTPQGTWTHVYGVADPATGAPMTSDMHMRIGSVTKTFTGTLILQLAQDGKLSLSDTVDKYVTGIPNGNRITLAMLSNMTSGVASYYTKPFLQRYFGDPFTVFTPDELVGYGVAASPVFSPGERFDYSNTNTILLGKVIEKVTKEPFGQVLQQRILTPLGLSSTSFPDTSPAIPAPHPQGFTLQGSGTPQHPANATDWNPSFGWAAGGMISTLHDMLIYDRALGTGRGMLSAKSQKTRLDSIPGPAGYGFAIGCIDGWVGHTGELPGFNSSVFYDTTSDTSVVVLVNSDIASGNCSESPTLTDNPSELPCASPATRIFVGLSEALGHTFHPNPAK
jgi:D-alanyl-D-alanine carboxypeptidase